ncbi:MAG: DUF1566 domain-containing protein [Deltaproteobacteria bacterium]|nr:DUF1566 domain-containing protein [Deltaproteobacteria bacterium]
MARVTRVTRVVRVTRVTRVARVMRAVRVAHVGGLVGFGLALGLLVPSSALGAPPAQSLARCQRTVAEEGTQFVTRVQQVVGRCLDAVSEETLRKERSAVDGAARACVNALDEILGNRGGLGAQARLESRIERWCVPGRPDVTHTAADVLGPDAILAQSIEARALGSRCAAFGGDGSIDSVEEWLDCVVEAHWSTSATAIVTEFPRALEWLSGLRPAMLGRSDSSQAVAALDVLVAEIETSGSVTPPILPATGQTISHAPGDDGALRVGAPLRFRDNGDGTLTDETTSLVWEKKSDDGGLHDKDGAFPWDIGAGSMWEWLASVNAEGGAGFAGKSDWRIPNKKELESIVDASAFNPALPAAFSTSCTAGCAASSCSCTGSLLHYWTSTSVAAAPTTFAWGMLPSSGAVLASNRKNVAGHVRVVRGP